MKGGPSLIIPGGWGRWVADNTLEILIKMHTVLGKAIIYSTPKIVGYLVVRKCSCFISDTENCYTSQLLMLWYSLD